MVLQGQVVMASLEPDPNYPYYPLPMVGAAGTLAVLTNPPAMAFLRIKLANSGHIVPLTILLADIGQYPFGSNVTVTIAPAV